MMDFLYVKFGDYSLSRFGSIAFNMFYFIFVTFDLFT